MNRVQRAGRRILDTAARLPVYALLVAATGLIISLANQPHMTTEPATTVRTPISSITPTNPMES